MSTPRKKSTPSPQKAPARSGTAERVRASSGAESASVVGKAQIRKNRVSATDKEFREKALGLNKPRTRGASAASEKRVFATVGSSTQIGEDGKITDDPGFYRKLQMARRTGAFNKNAGIFMDSGIGSANIADSENMQAYNFEFPNDALELPQSRREEIRYYRIAYDRDPIVGRAIDLHVELPLSKLILEKPKCSVESFADFVFDWFQGWCNDTKLFEQLLHGSREYWLIGEGYFFVEHLDDLEKHPLCPVAKRQLDRKERMRGPSPESSNPAEGVDELSIYQWTGKGKASKLLKEAHDLGLVNKTARTIEMDQSLPTLVLAVADQKQKIAAAVNAEQADFRAKYASQPKTAAPGDAPATDEAPPEPMMKGPLERINDLRGEAPRGGGGLPPMGGGGGVGGDLGGDMGLEGGPQVESEHVQNLRRYLKLLERKKTLLEELRALKEEKKQEWEMFSHVVNKDYFGPDRIVLLPPDVVEIRRDKRFNSEPTICYKPSEEQKAAYLDDPDVERKDKDMLEQDGLVPLNDDPNVGSYVLHFARKKAPFEDHGRSVLQRCLRTIIYRDKLRQVQNTLASRNMTPITLIVAEEAPVTELDALRVHWDEAKADPDYTVVVNYATQVQVIGAEGRLLALDSEWAHTNSELAVGMGFTPEILTGEGFFSGDRIRIELLNTTYLQFRDVLSDLVENSIFKPMAMRKGFYEIDDYGNPRWIYPKLSFSRLALRDQGDVYDMLFNLYAKGSLPVDIIYEFLNLDPETCKRKLEEDLLTVKDSKFNQVLDAIYAGVAERLFKTTDLTDKVSKSLQLTTKESSEVEGPEGTGEGM